jgi:hypothetical protein
LENTYNTKKKQNETGNKCRIFIAEALLGLSDDRRVTLKLMLELFNAKVWSGISRFRLEGFHGGNILFSALITL